jgi:ribose transport system substrate-binding protein
MRSLASPRFVALGAFVSILALAGGVARADANEDGRETVRIALVAKAQNNLVFQAAYRGALHAATTLEDEYDAAIELRWRTPRVEDARAQARQFERVTTGPDAVDGVAVSVVSPGVMKPLIDNAVQRGIPLVTFDGDAPASKRFAYYGEDNRALGRVATRRLCGAVGKSGTIAVLMANTQGENAKQRLAGMRAALSKFPNISLFRDGPVTHAASFHAGRARMREVQSRHPEIVGWVLLSAFPLFSEGGLDWRAELAPDRRPAIVAVDALPPQLRYLERGAVEALISQNCFAWGYESVRLLLEKLVRGAEPESPRVASESEVLETPADARRWRRRWDRWLRRRPGQ